MTLTFPISEEQIRLRVYAFCGKIRPDADLGPSFERFAVGDWETHLAKTCDFWSSAMLTTGPSKASFAAVRKHMGRLETDLLDRWLTLFGDSCGEVLDSETAGLCWLKAAHLVESLKLILSYRPGPAWLRHAA
ncbi:group III truncated hemoglobin (plasmid) [Mesorhizobium sp. B2-1-8]|uniref:group III truncated hemoglobin n=1 Tax=Mesorhizobium sp. B2-1-8 TaxID=2589967 RepID=UPI001125D034|nr:group III truncated hemoglobin [Mesorhizobium sp. B2-1-8]UCI22724.1 group III truncated hemoglobin [Mesorhizobium sp. B2-1-8]